jgi:bifunctional non-homologous end joining protein LigD
MKTFSPMLATIGTDLPGRGSWVFEPKYDGIRILASADGRRVALVSRNGIDKTRQFPEVADALRSLQARVKRPFVIDGEIVATHRDAPARFQALQGRMHVTVETAIERLRAEHPVALMVFDILLDGKKVVIAEPWQVRRQHLAALMRGAGRLRALRLGDVGEDGSAMLRKARRHGWEGVIAKRSDGRYDPGRRSRSWLKLKIERRQEFVIGGWTEPRNSREHIGAILLGYYDRSGSLVYAGHTGTGFSRQSLADLYRQLERVERKRSPFSTTPRTNEAAHWTRPIVVVEIKFNEWTSDGKLRQPVFIGVRTDKPAKEVVREPESIVRSARPTHVRPTHGRVRAKTVRRAAAASTLDKRRRKTTRVKAARFPAPARLIRQLTEIEESGGSGTLELPMGELDVSSLDKVFFPLTKHTKGDVMRFYASVSRVLLPAIADRPLVMKRFPNGVRGAAFYQQRAPAHRPSSVRVERVSDKGYAPQDKLIGGDLATLLYLVQLGAISVDPWHSRVQSIQFADYAIIDLDPGPRAPFGRVVEVAQAVKSVLDQLGLHAVPKTSGASGLHIVLPLGPRVPNESARTIAQLVATRVSEQYPKIATVTRSVGSRGRGVIYVDYLQNIRGKTVAGVYSVRAQPRPTVSTPLAWSEVKDDLDPAEFTIDTVPDRIRDVGDLWGKGMRRPNSLKPLTDNA